MKKHTKRMFIEMLIILILGLIAGLFITGCIYADGFGFNRNILDPFVWVFPASLLVIYVIKEFGKGESGGSSGKSGKKKQDDSQYFQGRLFTDKDLKNTFIYCRHSQIKNANFKSKSKQGDSYNEAGIMVKNEYNHNYTDSTNCFLPPIHTMVIGNTNTGKSQGFILPAIQCYAQMKSKPNMIISDIKGELFRDTNHKLVSEGYNVLTFNLRDPFRSDRWNPLDRAFDNYQRAINLKREVFLHRNTTPKEQKLKYDENANFGSVWFEFDGFAYPDEKQLEIAIGGKEQVLYAAAAEDINDIVSVIVPNDSKEAMWSLGARDFAKAILFAMLEDSKIPELGMTKEKFNFYNFYKIINIKDGGDNPYKTLKSYLSNRSKVFNVQELANSVINAAEGTASSFLATLNPNIGLFADPGIAFVTSGTDIDFNSFVQKPTAFFIRLPGEKETMNKIATIAIDQLYKQLVDFANRDIKLELPRPTFFILDEFANLPKLEKMPQYISVARSMRIYFILVLQDYTQLETKYEKAGASTIKNNCNVHVFIGSSDMNTLKEISEKCGKKVVTTEDKSVSKDSKDSKTTNTSKKEVQRELVFVEELRLLPKEKAVVIYDKTPPFYTNLGFFWRSKGCFDKEQTADSYRPARYLNENEVYYDIQGYLDYNKSKNAPKSRFDDFNFDF